MANFVISYDVRSSNHDYDLLYDLLKRWRAVPFLYSVYLVSRNAEASDIRDSLKAVLHKDDTIGVLLLPDPLKDWATRNVETIATDWLKGH